MTASLKTLGAEFALLALAACGGENGAAVSQEQESKVLPSGKTVGEVVEMRHEAMEEIGDNFKAINDQLKSGSPDIDAIRGSASVIADHASQVGGWFPEDTSPAFGVDTDSLATIWEQPEKFSEAVARFEKASADLNAAAQSGDAASISDAAKAIGGACKNCHDAFRADD